MKLICLVENTCSLPGLEGEHGLSLYLEQAKRRVLFDTGKTGLFFVKWEKWIFFDVKIFYLSIMYE